MSCEAGENCQYCHTRTEQQFHPEIYKSTKCNDIQNTSYCPRGAFCAFAHVEREFPFYNSSSQRCLVRVTRNPSSLARPESCPVTVGVGFVCAMSMCEPQAIKRPEPLSFVTRSFVQPSLISTLVLHSWSLSVFIFMRTVFRNEVLSFSLITRSSVRPLTDG